jgi:hypothetical protein
MKSRAYKPIPTRRASAKQEKAVARQLGGKVQPNSGATDYYKGDVVTDSMLIECKTVMKPQKTVSLKKEWFDKNEQERFATKKDYCALVFDYGDNGEQYIAMTLKQFNRMMEDKNA